MKRSRKIILVVGATILSFTSLSLAAFTSIKKQYLNAGTTTGGTKTISFTVDIKDTEQPEDSGPPKINWTNVDPTILLATDTWRIADQLIRVDSTITDLTGGIQIITDNTSDTANPRFYDPTPSISSNTDSNPAGLVMATGTVSNFTLPLAWSIKSSSKTVGSNNATFGILPSDPNKGTTDGAGNRYQWLYVLDKQTKAMDLNGSGVLGTGLSDDPDRNANGVDSTDFVDGQDYSRILDSRGIHYAQGNADGTPAFGGGTGRKISYIYLQCDFRTALPGIRYQTSKLTLEAFTE